MFCAETYIVAYVAHAKLKIDAEIAEKDPFRMETQSVMGIRFYKAPADFRKLIFETCLQQVDFFTCLA